VIVGGGFVGLSTELELTTRGEKSKVQPSATGRSHDAKARARRPQNIGFALRLRTTIYHIVEEAQPALCVTAKWRAPMSEMGH
jgi:hypothetical protein